ncbi:hypothetical protein, partial [Azospirillum sp. sgz301742]
TIPIAVRTGAASFNLAFAASRPTPRHRSVLGGTQQKPSFIPMKPAGDSDLKAVQRSGLKPVHGSDAISAIA